MGDALNLRVGMPRSYVADASVAFTAHTLDANNDGLGFIFQAEDTNPITHVGFRYGARTGTPPVYVAALEGVVTTTGAPDDADIGGGSPTAKTFTPPADATWDGTWQWIQLTNAFTPTRGQFLAFTIRYSSGTVDGSNNSTFTRVMSSDQSETVTAFPYASTLTAGSWAKTGNFPIYGIRTAASRYGNIIQSHYTTASASTVGHRRAMKFTLPADWGSTFKVKGFRFCGAIAGTTSGKAPIAGLWSAGGAVQTVTLDSDIDVSANSSLRARQFMFDEASLTALDFGTAYYIGLEVADAVSGQVMIQGAQLASGDDLPAFPGGANFHMASFDGSSWSDDTTVRPEVELILDDITEPAGGGGGIMAPLIGGSLVR